MLIYGKYKAIRKVKSSLRCQDKGAATSEASQLLPHVMLDLPSRVVLDLS
jgi:hypothetical protein